MIDQISIRHTYGTRIFDYAGRAYIMGVLNVTPDSFSDGGQFHNVTSAVSHAIKMLDEGADIIDIGGESTRPGSHRISDSEEKERVLPVIEELLKERPDTVISVDTYKSDVASDALNAGALIINDISALRFDKSMASVIRKFGASVILMHMKGEPKTMQENPTYVDVIDEIKTFLNVQIGFARRSGIDQILIDPGIGFGKRLHDNLEILRSLKVFTDLNCPVVIGTSRKSFIGKILDVPVDNRLPGSLASAVIGINNGASIVRAHDIQATKQAAAIVHAVKLGSDYAQEKARV